MAIKRNATRGEAREVMAVKVISAYQNAVKSCLVFAWEILNSKSADKLWNKNWDATYTASLT